LAAVTPQVAFFDSGHLRRVTHLIQLRLLILGVQWCTEHFQETSCRLLANLAMKD
jgi:hypothetical protein